MWIETKIGSQKYLLKEKKKSLGNNRKKKTKESEKELQ